MILERSAAGVRFLSYGTNVHPGETAAEIADALEHTAVPLKQRLQRNAPFALGLRLGETAVRELEQDPAAFDRFASFLARHEFCVYSLNVFPQGVFHAPVVKEAVYEPPWTSESRAHYTLSAARLLGRLMPADSQFGTLSTSPLAFSRAGDDVEQIQAGSARRLADLAHELSRHEESSGIRLAVCLEPEPACLLANTAHVVSFYEKHLLPAARKLPEVAGRGGTDQVLRHVGVCLDACHLSVEFEDPVYGLERLARNGIGVWKIQISCALEILRPRENQAGLRQLAGFDEARFLHQVTARDERGTLHHFTDLRPFLEWAPTAPVRIESARCHFHVPIHAPAPFPLHSTQPQLLDLLNRERQRREVPHLEVETYSFGVLPPGADARGTLVDDLESELRFASDRLV